MDKPTTIVIPMPNKKTDYIQARLSTQAKQAISEYSLAKGVPMTTLILMALANTYPELTEVIDRERRGEPIERLPEPLRRLLGHE